MLVFYYGVLCFLFENASIVLFGYAVVGKGPTRRISRTMLFTIAILLGMYAFVFAFVWIVCFCSRWSEGTMVLTTACLNLGIYLLHSPSGVATIGYSTVRLT